MCTLGIHPSLSSLLAAFVFTGRRRCLRCKFSLVLVSIAELYIPVGTSHPHPARGGCCLVSCPWADTAPLLHPSLGVGGVQPHAAPLQCPCLQPTLPGSVQPPMVPAQLCVQPRPTLSTSTGAHHPDLLVWDLGCLAHGA